MGQGAGFRVSGPGSFDVSSSNRRGRNSAPIRFCTAGFAIGPRTCAILVQNCPRTDAHFKMMTDAQIDALATHLVQGLIARGSIKPKVSEKDLVACVVELMSSNFETEAKIDDEADRMAEEQARLDSRLDVTRLRGMIRQRLAEKKNFTL